MSSDLIRIHGWILFTLFAHGVLLAYVMRHRLVPILERDFYACLLVVGFVLSLLTNVIIVAVASVAGLVFERILWILIALDVVLLAVVWRRRGSPRTVARNTSLLLWPVVAVCFLLMMANGGLVNLLADSWWHMSLANEIVEQQSIFIDRHHLLGTPRQSWDFVYEPGWHLNLALILDFSGSPAPMLWHALAPWCVLVSLLSYYLLALVLCDSARVALMAVILMALLIGGINAYFRVSPWPGNVAYALMYFALSLVLSIADSTQWRHGEARTGFGFNPFRALLRVAREAWPLVTLLLLVLTTMATLHLAEIFWVVAALVFYSLGLHLLSASRSLAGNAALIRDNRLLAGLWLWFFVIWSLLSIWRQPQLAAVVAVVAAVLVVLAVAARLLGPLAGGRAAPVWLVLCAAISYLLIDAAHLQALFQPQPATTDFYSAYIPQSTRGYFGATVLLPQWEHQLRAGLLLNGVLGVVLSVLLVFRQATRASVFLSATAVFSLVVIISPYMFTFFTGLLPATGVYRFQILILHPIILACVIAAAVNELQSERRPRAGAY